MPAGTPDDVDHEVDVDLDLDATPQPRAGGPGSVLRGAVRSRLAWAAGGLAVGLLAGQAWEPTGDPEPTAPVGAAPVAAAPVAAAPVRMAFGARAGGTMEEMERLGHSEQSDRIERIGRRIVVTVPAVVVNETSSPLVVRGLRVSGPGAGVETAPYGSFTGLPLNLPPGETVELPFRLISDCTVPVRPVPRITLVVAPDDGSAGLPVEVRVPDLGSLWGRTLHPELCRA